MKQVDRDLGALVKDYRVKKDITQLELGRKLGYDSPQFISLFERGLSKVPLNVLGKLIKILGIPEKKVMNALLEAYEENVRAQIDSGKKMVG